MQRFLALIIVGMLVIAGLTGCDEPETADPEEMPEIEEPADPVFEEEEEPEPEPAAEEAEEEEGEEEGEEEEGDDEE